MRKLNKKASKRCSLNVLHEAQTSAVVDTDLDLEETAPVGASPSSSGTRAGEKKAAKERLGEPIDTGEDVERRFRKRLRAAACFRVPSVAWANIPPRTDENIIRASRKGDIKQAPHERTP